MYNDNNTDRTDNNKNINSMVDIMTTNNNDNSNLKGTTMTTETITDREAYVQHVKDEIKKEVLEDSDKYFSFEIHTNLEDLISRINKNPNFVTNERGEVSSILQSSLDELMKATNIFSGKSVLYGVTIGKACIMIKRVLKEKKAGNFTKFIKDIGYNQRTVNKYMVLAEFEDVKDFAYLGMERLQVLVGVIKDSEYRGNIAEFIEYYKISYAPLMDMKDSVEAFRMDVSVSMLKYLNIHDKWDVHENILKKYANSNAGNIKYDDLRDGLAKSIKTGSNPSQYFNLLIEEDQGGKNIGSAIDRLVENMDELKDDIIAVRTKQKVRGKIGLSKVNGLMEQLSLLKDDVETHPED